METDYSYLAVDGDEMPMLFRSDNHRGPPLEWANYCFQVSQHEKDNDAGRAFWLAMAMEIRHAQVFDFGTIDDKDLRVESKRGSEIWQKGFLRAPYRSCIYWYENVPDPETIKKMLGEGADMQLLAKRQRYCTLLVEAPDEIVKASGWNPPLMMIADFLRMDEMRGDYRTAYALGGAAMVGNDNHDPARWVGKRVSAQFTPASSREHDAPIVGSLIDGVVGLSMILSTKNIPVRVEEVSEKLNKKRVASGKQPLVRVTHVDSSRYHAAIKNTREKGTHASPVPHMRRGHLRTYADGHQIWIKDMLVNAKSHSELGARDHYEVTA
jgi:hypothetical protein